MENLQKTVNIQSFTYQHNLLSSSRDCKIYLATTPHNKNLHPLVFKGYPQMVLNDPVKQKKLIQQIKFLWKLTEKDNIIKIISQHYRDRMVFIITQYCQGGNLANNIKNYGHFTEEKAINYLKKIINGYKQVHKASIIHRNLEPSNILISGLDVKIGDFSDAIERKDALLTSKKEQIVGTLIYQAPEVLEKYMYSQQSDIYSIGLIFYAMIKGSSPFNGSNKAEILQQMKVFKVENLFDQKLSKKSKNFLMKCLTFDADKRMKVEQMVNYTFYQISKLSLNRFLTFDQETPQKQTYKTNELSLRQNQQNQQPSSKIIKLLSIINDAVPQKVKGNTSSTSINLKMSQELDLSKLSNRKDISILIPSKLDLKLIKKESNNIRVTKKLADQITSLDFQPSIMILPSQKDHSNSSKKSQKQICKDDIIEQKPINSRNSAQMKPNYNKKQEFTGRTLDTERVKPKQSAIVQQFTIKTSRNKQPIQVVVHSPKKKAKASYSQSTIKEDTGDNYLILCYLLSQVDLSRFISRIIYYIQKVNEMQSQQLCQALRGLQYNILTNIKQLTLIEEQSAQIFKRSQEYAQLLQIVQIYQLKSIKRVHFQSTDKTSQLLKIAILFLFSDIKESTRFSEHKIKALDHMVKCYQLIKLLQKGNLQTFYQQSGVQQLVNINSSVKIQTLLEVNSRLRVLKLINK